jgi:hypothetical protein
MRAATAPKGTTEDVIDVQNVLLSFCSIAEQLGCPTGNPAVLSLWGSPGAALCCCSSKVSAFMQLPTGPTGNG